MDQVVKYIKENKRYFGTGYWRYDLILGDMIVTRNGVVPMSDENKTATISYAVEDIPKPLTNPDVYMRAQLIEMRATRALFKRMVEAIETLSAQLAANSVEEKVNKAKK